MRTLLAVLMLFASSVDAADLSPWFKSLKQPLTGMSCCDISDCRRLESDQVRMEGGEYWVNPYGDWLRVPPEKVLHGYGNPTGVPVACASPTMVWCFVEGVLS